MRKIRVAVNGCGRIGRAFVRLALDNDDLEITAINDLAAIDNMAYLFKYDSVYGEQYQKVEVAGDIISLNGKNLKYLKVPEARDLPWAKMGIDVVVEATGRFTDSSLARAHIDAGAKKVVITAPVKAGPGEGEKREVGDEGAQSAKVETVLMGINEEKLEQCDISSNASCTTNAGSPVLAILNEAIGVEKALLNTVHAYTASQSLVDAPSKKDLREGRAAAHNIVPSSTGAAIATTKALTELDGKFDGISIRVPVIIGSIADITFVAKRETSIKEVNEVLRAAAAAARWQGIFSVTEDDLVSSDIKRARWASIADLKFTRVVGSSGEIGKGDLIKVLAWYDNEWGYVNTLLKHVIKAGKTLFA